MNMLKRYGKALLFLVLAVSLVCLASAAFADTEITEHSWTNRTLVKPATCVDRAVYQYTCSTCGETKTQEEGELNADAHAWGEWVVEKAATCTETGSRYRTCNNSPLHHKQSETIPALGHDFKWIVDKEATCTSTGFRRQVCSRCGLENASETIPMTAHQPGNWETTKEPTCTQEGEQARKCTVCGTKVEVKTLGALGHDYGNWETTKEPTCTAKGVQTRVCSRDASHKETRDLDPLGHVWGDWTVTKQPTCTVKGTETRTCGRDASHAETRDIDPIGHKWDNGKVTTPATCDKDGVKTYACQNDPSHTKTEPIPAIGHKWDKGRVTKAASFEEPGEIVYTCTIDPSHTKTEKIPAKTLEGTICVFGPRLRDSSTILYPNTTEQWYMFTPFSVSEIEAMPGGKMEYEMVGSNAHIVGRATIVIQDGQLTFDYTLFGNTVKIDYEFYTILNQITELDRYEPEDLRSLNMSATRRQPIDLNEYFGEDDQLVLYFCSRGTYSYNRQIKGLDYNSLTHRQLLDKMSALID